MSEEKLAYLEWLFVCGNCNHEQTVRTNIETRGYEDKAVNTTAHPIPETNVYCKPCDSITMVTFDQVEGLPATRYDDDESTDTKPADKSPAKERILTYKP